MDINLNDAMLCWNTNGDAKVVLHPDVKGISDKYEHSVGACFRNWRKRDGGQQLLQLFIEAWHAVAFYGVAPAEMHRALSVIPQYRYTLSFDVAAA